MTYTLTDMDATDATTITLSGAGQYDCENWAKSIPYNTRATIQATFREVFEP